MNLTWSHAVLNVRDEEKMLGFYTNVLGFRVTDRGPLGEGGSDIAERGAAGEEKGDEGPDLIFMSQSLEEHHQLAMIAAREDDSPSNSLNHIAFRVSDYKDLPELYKKLVGWGGLDVFPLSHGNTLSLYFHDPEQNVVEVFWDTPWHVKQPAGQPWNPELSTEEALEWLKENWKNDTTLETRDEYFTRHPDIILQ